MNTPPFPTSFYTSHSVVVVFCCWQQTNSDHANRHNHNLYPVIIPPLFQMAAIIQTTSKSPLWKTSTLSSFSSSLSSSTSWWLSAVRFGMVPKNTKKSSNDIVVSMFANAIMSKLSSSVFNVGYKYPWEYDLVGSSRNKANESNVYDFPYLHEDTASSCNSSSYSSNSIFVNKIPNNVNETDSTIQGIREKKVHVCDNNSMHQEVESMEEEETTPSALQNLSIWWISTLKRRKKKMNKHKLRKRRKLLRLKSKK